MEGKEVPFQPGNTLGKRFKKGQVSKNKGQKHSEEARQKMRAAWVGRVISPETRVKLSKALQGRVFSDEHRRKLKESRKNRIEKPRKLIPRLQKKCPVCPTIFEVLPSRNDKVFCCYRCAMIGKKQGKRPDTRGAKNPNWRGGVTPLRLIIHASFQYKAWRRSIFGRDNKTCQACGRTDRPLQVHHTPYEFADIIKDFNIKCFTDALYCPILWDTDNGQVLCVDCHKRTFHGARHALSSRQVSDLFQSRREGCAINVLMATYGLGRSSIYSYIKRGNDMLAPLAKER